MANYFVFLAVTQVLGLAAWGFTVFAAFRDYKHLESVGVVRPFHWAFAFIPYTIVYLIGRHVVLRRSCAPRVGRSGRTSRATAWCSWRRSSGRWS